MKRFLLLTLVLAVSFALIFTGCSGGSKNEYYEAPSMEAPVDRIDREGSFNGGSTNVDPNVIPELPANRKVIRDAELSVETLEFDAFISSINAKMAELGGYVQSNNVSGKAYNYGSGLRSANMVIRIPAEKLDSFLSAVDGLGNVISRSENVDDVTDTYVDTEARIESLRTEYQTLLDLLAKAETLEDIITLQDRLSDVRYEMESYEARLRSYDSLIAYSTVTIRISEVERVTAAEPETFGEEVSRRFSESLEDVGDGFKSFASWFIGNLPTIVVLLVLFVGLPLLIVLICVKSARKRKAKRTASSPNAAADNIK